MRRDNGLMLGELRKWAPASREYARALGGRGRSALDDVFQVLEHHYVSDATRVRRLRSFWTAAGVKRYGFDDASIRAVDDVDVGFEERRFTGIMGPPSSGKSTLLHTLAGLDTLDEGSAYIGEVAIGERLVGIKRDSPFAAELAFDSEQAAASAKSAIRSIGVPVPLRAALTEVQVDSVKLRLRLQEVNPVSLAEVKPDRITSCILRTGR